MKTKYFFFVFFSGLLLTCSSAKTSATPEQIQLLDEIVAGKSFKIESQWALPQSSRSLIAIQNAGLMAPGDSASRISLIGNSNFLEISGDSIQSYLPYFGERQMVSNRNGNGSIEFEDTIKDYTVIKNENNNYTLEFEATSKNESFDVVIQIFPNLKTDMLLKGSKRFPIRYTGTLIAVSE